MTAKIVLVTGGSSGIGEATALTLAARGHTVYAAARRTERLDELVADGVRPLAVDVTDDESARTGVEKILAEAGRVDVLVNNAGYGSYGAIEDVPLDEARRQFEVNVFGAARMARLVLPHMRKQRSGTIVNVSSMGGKVYFPMGGWYHGTKFALEGLSDCLRLETAPFGIHVVVIEPGAVASEWGGIAVDSLHERSGTGAYASQARAVADLLDSEKARTRQSSPHTVADAIAKAVDARRPKARYAMGFGAKPLIALKWLLPDRAFDLVVRRVAGLDR